MRRKLIPLVLSLILYGVLSSYSQSYSVSSIPEELKKNANSVVRSNEVFVSIPSQNKLILRLHRAITVLNKGGNSHVDAYVDYDDSRKVRKLQATIYNASGKEIQKFKKGDFEDIGGGWLN